MFFQYHKIAIDRDYLKELGANVRQQRLKDSSYLLSQLPTKTQVVCVLIPAEEQPEGQRQAQLTFQMLRQAGGICPRVVKELVRAMLAPAIITCEDSVP